MWGSMMGMGNLDDVDDPIFGQHMHSLNQMSGMMNSMLGGGMFGGMPEMPGMMMPGMLMGGMLGAGMPGLMPMGASSSTTMIQSNFGAPPMLMGQPNQRNGAVSNSALMSFGGGSPFDMMGAGGPFGGLNRLLMSGGGGSETVFSSSQVVSMSRGPDGRPQVYKASSSMKKGPNGVRQTQKTVEDSRSGVRKMAVGHHIGDRSHVVERERNYRTGEQEERQDFINLDEDEVEDFQSEFQQRSNGMLTNGSGQRHAPAIMPAGPSAAAAPLAIMPPAVSPTRLSPHQQNTGTNSEPSARSDNGSVTATPLATPRRAIRRPFASSPLTTSIHSHPYGGASSSASGGRRQRPKKSANTSQQPPCNSEYKEQ